MSRPDRVFDLIFDNPMSLSEIVDATGYEKQHVFKIIQGLPTDRVNLGTGNDLRYVIYSGEDNDKEDEQEEQDSFLGDVMK